MISIIIPAYNRESTIKLSVESVLNQTVRDIEVLVIDDGSTDNTAEVIKEIHDKRVNYVYQENAGACVARNLGIKLSKGDILAFHDSDDQWLPNKLEEEVKSLNENDADIVFCQMFKKGKIIPDCLEEGFVSSLTFLQYGNIIGTPTIIGKKKCFEKIQFDPLMPRLQDRDIAIRLSKEFRVFFLKKALMTVELQENSITRNEKKGKIALERIMEKNKSIIVDHPKIECELLSNLCVFKLRCDENCDSEFKRILTLERTLKNYIKYILYKAGILKRIYKLER